MIANRNAAEPDIVLVGAGIMSATLGTVLKELEPTTGRIIVGNRDLGRLKRGQVPRLRRNIGCVFQDFKLLPSRSAADRVAAPVSSPR